MDAGHFICFVVGILAGYTIKVAADNIKQKQQYGTIKFSDLSQKEIEDIKKTVRSSEKHYIDHKI